MSLGVMMSGWMRALVGSALWAWAGAAGAATFGIGAALPLTGDKASEGVALQAALELWVEDANASGVLGDDTFVLKVVDDGNNPTTAQAAAQTLVADTSVIAVVGHVDTPAALAAADVYEKAGLPLITPYVSNPALTRGRSSVFSMNVPNDVQADTMAVYLQAVLEADRVAVLSATDDYGTTLTRGFLAKAGRIGLAVEKQNTFSEDKVTEKLVTDMFPEAEANRGGRDGGPGGDRPGGPGGGDRPGAPGERPGDGGARPPGGGDRPAPPGGRGGRGGGGGSPWLAPDGGGDPPEEGAPPAPRRSRQGVDVGVDAIVLLCGPEAGAKLTAQIRKLGIGVPVIGPEAFADDAFRTSLGKSTRDVYVTTAFNYELGSFQAMEFVDRFVAKLGVEPTVKAAFAYDAGAAIAAAMAGGARDRVALRTALSAANTPETAMSLLTGEVYFDEHGSAVRHLVFSVAGPNSLKPAFTQLRRVTQQHVLNSLNRGGGRSLARTAAGRDVIVVDGVPWWRTKVVYAGIDFFRTDNVDVSGQSFRVEFYLWLRWEGELDVENIGFVNEIFSEESTKEVLREDLESRVRYVCFKSSGVFLYPYDLRDFPFDTQWLPMQLTHRTRDTNEVILVVDHDNVTNGSVDEIYPEEWVWVGRKDAAGTFTPKTSFGDPAYAGRGGNASFSVYEAKLGIKRILFPYLVKLFMPLGMMIAITLLVFLVPRDAFDARMTLVMTALLSILVFHLAQAEALPTVGYLMRADHFFMVTYILVFALTIKTVVVNAFVAADKDGAAKWIDLLFAVLFLPAAALVYGGLVAVALMM